MAVLANISTGYFVDRMPVMWVVLISSALSAISPLLMAVIDPQWPYWYMAFTAQVSKLTMYNVLSSFRPSNRPPSDPQSFTQYLATPH
jgi:hypothetical protein